MRALAAANELDDFVAVAGGDLRFRPGCARKNFEIAFDGDAARLEGQGAQQIGDRGAGSDGASFPVDGDGKRLKRGVHALIIRGLEGAGSGVMAPLIRSRRTGPGFQLEAQLAASGAGNGVNNEG